MMRDWTMQIKAEHASEALRIQQILPIRAVLRLTFPYDIYKELSQVPSATVETVALLFDAGRRSKDLHAQIWDALAVLGAEPLPAAPIRKVQSIDLWSGATAISWSVSVPQSITGLRSMQSQEHAFEAAFACAKKLGCALAEATGAVGWRMPVEAMGAISVMDGLDKSFDDLIALGEALALQKELASIVPPLAPSSPRHIL